MAVLFAEFADTIPLHQAVRGASTRRNATLAEYRWFAMSAHMRSLNVTFDPPIMRCKPGPARTVVIPQTRVCLICGTPFFAARDRKHCSPQCWGLPGLRKARKSQAP